MILLPADVSIKCHNCTASNLGTPLKLCYEAVKPQRDDATTLDTDITTILWIWTDHLNIIQRLGRHFPLSLQRCNSIVGGHCIISKESLVVLLMDSLN